MEIHTYREYTTWAAALLAIGTTSAAEAERARVRQALQDGPLTTREISSRLGLPPGRARRRAREARAVRDEAGRWGLDGAGG